MKRAVLSIAIGCVLLIGLPVLAGERGDTTDAEEGMIRGSVGIGMAAPGGSYLMVLPITMPWLDTGIDLRVGDTLKIVAAPAKNHPPCDGKTGCPPYRDPGAVIVDGSLGTGLTALVGRVGDTGRPFSIGGTYDGPVPGVGRLYLGYNDCWDCWGDNTGAFEVTIEVKTK